MKLKLAHKLIGGFLIVSLLVLVAGVIGIYNVGIVGKAADIILDEEVPIADASMEMMIQVISGRDLMGEYLLCTDPDGLAEIEKEFYKVSEEFDGFAEGIVQGGTVGDVKIIATDSQKIRDLVKKADDYHAKYEEAAENMMKHHKRAISGKKYALSSDEQKAREYMELVDEYSEKADLTMDEVEVAAGEEMDNAMINADNAQNSARNMLIGTTVIGVLLGFGFGFFLSRSITVPISQVVQRANYISSGDLSFEKLNMARSDEVGELARALDNMAENLDNAMGQIASASSQVASSSQELSSTSEEMASGSEEQTSQTSQVATSVEEMSATVQQVAKNSNLAAGKAKTAGDTAKKGGEVVELSISGMTKIAEAVKGLQVVIQGLSRNSEKIGDIVGVIDDVADQTNLLALNAAIEAARAGEQGRGFAVVADEVRKLAERTSSSTKEISDMVRSIQGDTTQAVSSMEMSAKEVTEGTKLSQQAGEALREIVNGALSVQEMVTQIATAAEQQSAAAEEISSNVESIASVSKQTASGAQQTSSSAQELSGLSDELQQLVNRFKLKNKIEIHQANIAKKKTAAPVKFDVVNHKNTQQAKTTQPQQQQPQQQQPQQKKAVNG